MSFFLKELFANLLVVSLIGGMRRTRNEYGHFLRDEGGGVLETSTSFEAAGKFFYGFIWSRPGRGGTVTK